MNLKIQGLFFDLDNTLADDSSSLYLSLQQALPILTARYPKMTQEIFYPVFREVNNRHWENYDESPISQMSHPVEIRTLIARETLQVLGIDAPDLARELAARFQETRSTTYACYPDTLPFLQAWKGILPLVLITNGNAEMQREKLRNCGLEPLFDAVFIAQEAGISKPDPALFHRALDTVHTAPEHALMIGDHLEKDIQGAQSAGMRTAWMRRDGRSIETYITHPDFIVCDLSEIQEIINNHEC